jgi:hypothetical protein
MGANVSCGYVIQKMNERIIDQDGWAEVELSPGLNPDTSANVKYVAIMMDKANALNGDSSDYASKLWANEKMIDKAALETLLLLLGPYYYVCYTSMTTAKGANIFWDFKVAGTFYSSDPNNIDPKIAAFANNIDPPRTGNKNYEYSNVFGASANYLLKNGYDVDCDGHYFKVISHLDNRTKSFKPITSGGYSSDISAYGTMVYWCASATSSGAIQFASLHVDTLIEETTHSNLIGQNVKDGKRYRKWTCKTAVWTPTTPGALTGTFSSVNVGGPWTYGQSEGDLSPSVADAPRQYNINVYSDNTQGRIAMLRASNGEFTLMMMTVGKWYATTHYYWVDNQGRVHYQAGYDVVHHYDDLGNWTYDSDVPWTQYIDYTSYKEIISVAPYKISVSSASLGTVGGFSSPQHQIAYGVTDFGRQFVESYGLHPACFPWTGSDGVDYGFGILKIEWKGGNTDTRCFFLFFTDTSVYANPHNAEFTWWNSPDNPPVITGALLSPIEFAGVADPKVLLGIWGHSKSNYPDSVLIAKANIPGGWQFNYSNLIDENWDAMRYRQFPFNRVDPKTKQVLREAYTLIQPNIWHRQTSELLPRAPGTWMASHLFPSSSSYTYDRIEVTTNDIIDPRGEPWNNVSRPTRPPVFHLDVETNDHHYVDDYTGDVSDWIWYGGHTPESWLENKVNGVMRINTTLTGWGTVEANTPYWMINIEERSTGCVRIEPRLGV